MRKQFSQILHNEMGKNEKIYLLTGDLGYGLWDRIKIDFPDRFCNVGSSEQLMMGSTIASHIFTRSQMDLKNIFRSNLVKAVLANGDKPKGFHGWGYRYTGLDIMSLKSEFV